MHEAWWLVIFFYSCGAINMFLEDDTRTEFPGVYRYIFSMIWFVPTIGVCIWATGSILNKIVKRVL